MKLQLRCLSLLLLAIQICCVYGDASKSTELNRYFIVLKDYSSAVKSASVDHGDCQVGNFLSRYRMLTVSRVQQQAYQLPQVREYTSLIVGYTTLMDDAALNAIKKMNDVNYVEKDVKTKIFFPIGRPPGLPIPPLPLPLPNIPRPRLPFPIPFSTSAQTDALWHLDRINQRSLPLDKRYSPTLTGDGTDIYVIDTGIRYTHRAFGGRAVFGGYDFQPWTAPNGQGSDCDGHGTHVAGLAGGFGVGPATGARLLSIRVLDCNGDGTSEALIRGMEHVILSSSRSKRIIMSMSLSLSARLRTVDDYIKLALDRSILSVAAAGNEFKDACNLSPAYSEDAITVGATNNRDSPAYFTNYGSCVDIFAPGENVVSADSNGDGLYKLNSGTSMAAPIVSGVAATLWQQNPWMNARVLASHLLAEGTKDVLNFSILPSSQRAQTPNLMLFQRNAASGRVENMSTEMEEKLAAEKAAAPKPNKNALKKNSFMSRFKSVLATRARDH